MTQLLKNAFGCGLLLGSAQLIWLYLAYYLGLHTSGIAVFQLFMLGWFLLTSLVFVFLLRRLRRSSDLWSYRSGMLAGLAAAMASALMAVIAQLGYWTLVHPEWRDYMIAETQRHFEALGLPAREIEARVEHARASFTLRNYAIQSAFGAFFTGLVISAIAMIFLRRKAIPPTPPSP